MSSVSYYYGFEGKDVFVEASVRYTVPDEIDIEGVRCRDAEEHEYVFLSMPDDEGAKKTLENSCADVSQPYYKFPEGCRNHEVVVVDTIHGMTCVPRVAITRYTEGSFTAEADSVSNLSGDVQQLTNVHVFADDLMPMVEQLKKKQTLFKNATDDTYVYEQGTERYHLHQMPQDEDTRIHALTIINSRDDCHFFEPDETLQDKRIVYDFSVDGVRERQILSLRDHMRHAADYIGSYVGRETLEATWPKTNDVIHVVGDVFEADKISFYKGHKGAKHRPLSIEEGAFVEVGTLRVAFYKSHDDLPVGVSSEHVVDVTNTSFNDKKLVIDHEGLHSCHKRALILL